MEIENFLKKFFSGKKFISGKNPLLPTSYDRYIIRKCLFYTSCRKANKEDMGLPSIIKADFIRTIMIFKSPLDNHFISPSVKSSQASFFKWLLLRLRFQTEGQGARLPPYFMKIPELQWRGRTSSRSLDAVWRGSEAVWWRQVWCLDNTSTVLVAWPMLGFSSSLQGWDWGHLQSRGDQIYYFLILSK